MHACTCMHICRPRWRRHKGIRHECLGPAWQHSGHVCVSSGHKRCAQAACAAQCTAQRWCAQRWCALRKVFAAVAVICTCGSLCVQLNCAVFQSVQGTRSHCGLGAGAPSARTVLEARVLREQLQLAEQDGVWQRQLTFDSNADVKAALQRIAQNCKAVLAMASAVHELVIWCPIVTESVWPHRNHVSVEMVSLRRMCKVRLWPGSAWSHRPS
jgi:hypothetical protein